MRKICIAIALAGALSAPTLQAALEGTVKVSDALGLGTTSGGAFWIDVTAATSINMQNIQSLGDPFLSFCLEVPEHISYGTTYSTTVNNQAIQGGGGPNPDPLSLASAWLYRHFRDGDLALQPGAGAFAMNDAGGNAFQQAIWWLENETPGVNNYLVAAAQTALGANYLNDANGAYDVRVMNLYTVNGAGQITDYNQSMLAVVPEPSTVIAGALLLLPFGASTIRFIRKNRTA